MSWATDMARQRLAAAIATLKRNSYETASYAVTCHMEEKVISAIDMLIDAKIEESKEKKDE